VAAPLDAAEALPGAVGVVAPPARQEVAAAPAAPSEAAQDAQPAVVGPVEQRPRAEALRAAAEAVRRAAAAVASVSPELEDAVAARRAWPLAAAVAERMAGPSMPARRRGDSAV
jgi:hypothetical protein